MAGLVNHAAHLLTTALTTTWLFCLGSVFMISTASFAEESAKSINAQIASVKNSMIDWRIDGSLDVRMVFEDSVEKWFVSTDRDTVITCCLKMLEDEDRWIAGHVVLCRLFGLADICTEFQDRAMILHLHGMSVAIDGNADWSSTPTVSYLAPSEQQQVSYFWETLQRHGAERFAKFEPPAPSPRFIAKSYAKTVDPALLELTVKDMVASGPKWVSVGLGRPWPAFPQPTMTQLRLQKEVATAALLDALADDTTFAAAHLALCELYATNRRYYEESNGNLVHTVTDGLTVDIEVKNEQPRYHVVYPKAAFERNFLRHRWVMRTNAWIH